MITQKEMSFKKDTAGKQIHISRGFDAPVEKVWKAWTDPAILDQWWAPKPFKAVTQSMDFRPGGTWRYYMEGPDGARHYCRVDYDKITPGASFSGKDAFCDEKGDVLTELPVMYWVCDFKQDTDATVVNVSIRFDSLEDMDKIIEMGFREGFAAAHSNLDEILG